MRRIAGGQSEKTRVFFFFISVAILLFASVVFVIGTESAGASSDHKNNLTQSTVFEASKCGDAIPISKQFHIKRIRTSFHNQFSAMKY